MSTAGASDPEAERTLADRIPVLKTHRKLQRMRAMYRADHPELLQARKDLKSLRKQVSSLEKVAAALLEQGDRLRLLPPAELRTNVGRTEDAANFYYQGLDSSARVRSVFGDDPSGPVLDWGCGSGRTLQWLYHSPGWRACYRGCDVDRAAIDWLGSQGVTAVLPCSDLPPLPYQDGTFAGLFCFSVLTHIPPDRHRAWYEEIHRVLQPGGRALLTVHGDSLMTNIRSFTAAEREAYVASGQCWSERDGHYKHAAVVSQAFTRAALEPLFEIEHYAPQGYHLMDAIIVRKAASA